MNHYEVLGVSHKATLKEIDDAYRALARECHPDTHPEDIQKAIERFWTILIQNFF